MEFVIDTKYATSLKSIVLSTQLPPNDLRQTITRLGEEIGKRILTTYFLSAEGYVLSAPPCAVVTTRDDFELLGAGITSILRNTINGYMDFKGQRGIQALTSDIRHMMLPDAKGLAVDSLVIAKAVLATGCTAVRLAKTAFNKYLPRKLIIASIFYTPQALAELRHQLPNADMILVGQSDELDKNGMLSTVGYLDKRLKE